VWIETLILGRARDNKKKSKKKKEAWIANSLRRTGRRTVAAFPPHPAATFRKWFAAIQAADFLVWPWGNEQK